MHGKAKRYLGEEDGRECHENVHDGDAQADVWPEFREGLREDIVGIV